MKYYIELTLLTDSDISPAFLWQKLYQQLHLAFVEVKNSEDKINIGVSFPEYQQRQGGLGKKIRLFGKDKQSLKALNLEQWLNRLTDYIHVKSIKNVPEKIKYQAVFKRLHEKGNIEKLARRRVKHLKTKKIEITYQQALDFFKDTERLQSKLMLEKYPFINMQSLSSKQRHSLFIGTEKVDKLENKAIFNTYGLSTTENKSAVPIF